jgi:hypothetical protein
MYWRKWRHIWPLALMATLLVTLVVVVVGEAQDTAPITIGEKTPVIFELGVVLIFVGLIWTAAMLIAPLKDMLKNFKEHTENDRKMMYGNGSGNAGVITTLELINAQLQGLGQKLAEHCGTSHLREVDIVTKRDYAMFIEASQTQRREEHETLRAFMDTTLASLQAMRPKF